MNSRSDPWYIHAALYVVIAILTLILIKVAIIDPHDYVETEKFYQTESRLRMNNIKEAEIIWQRKSGNYTNSIDTLISFIKSPYVDSLINAFDSLVMKVNNPFKKLANGEFNPDSLRLSPKTFSPYILLIDTSVVIDSFINRRGKITRVDTSIILGNRYYLEDPDGYGTVGNLDNEALKNTASWE